MILTGLWNLFQRRIFTMKSTPGLFNPYRGRDPAVDKAAASRIRQNNLFGYLDSFRKNPAVLLLGEAPGPWGCRFSGIPFTGERQLLANKLPFSGQQSSRDDPLIKVRKTTPYISNSAGIFWSTMLPFHPRFIVWNCVPLHPYKTGYILSVRTPTAREVIKYSNILFEIVSILKPKKIVAVGRKAQFSLDSLGFPCDYVRHPSQGGANRFKRGIECALTFL
jgi:uracil-DNA glycosylase